MILKLLLILAATFVVANIAIADASAPKGSLADFQKSAVKFGSIITVPTFETTTNAVFATVKATIAAGDAALDRIGKLDPAKVTFDNTIRALDDLAFTVGVVMNRLSLIKESSTSSAVRDAATEAIKQLTEWAVGLDYREDVYKSVKAYAETKPKLAGEDARLLEETMRDYRRAGLQLPRKQRDEVERLRKELTNLTTDFDSNITKAQTSLTFTKAELAGVPEDFLAAIKTGDDQYMVKANVTFQYLAVMDNAKQEATRKRLLIARDNLARAENIPLLEKILVVRDRIAKTLGYENWADYQIEVKMAKNAKTATEFLTTLKKGLQPKFDAELEEFRELKVKETGDAGAAVRIWDWRYYANELKKQKYTVDAEQLRVYFPYQRVLDGMFAIYQRIFGLKFQQVEPPYKWISDLQFYAVSDASTGEPLGLFYLDMFPRQGKYNHFAVFPIIEGKLLPDGNYQRPVVALVCNFPPPSKDKPPLLAHTDVETLFHEFGHAMHGIVTRAKRARFSGSNVPRDFVEAPSQMLENWVWDKKVLDSFAADYRNPSKKIPADILAKLEEARLATEATRYRRQLSFGLMDLALHTQINTANATNTLPLALKTLGEVFLPLADDTAFIAYFGHLTGYDAGYYGYAWADAISADMATVFENSPDGYFDQKTGMRLRDEIYAQGNARDVNESIEIFLGRPRSIKPFLNQIGIKEAAGGKSPP